MGLGKVISGYLSFLSGEQKALRGKTWLCILPAWRAEGPGEAKLGPCIFPVWSTEGPGEAELGFGRAARTEAT